MGLVVCLVFVMLLERERGRKEDDCYWLVVLKYV